MIYLIGSLRNLTIPATATALARAGIDVYSDWWSPGPKADDHWQKHCYTRGMSYVDAINTHHARDVFETDKRHLDASSGAVLVMPSGRSGHLEAGYMVGRGKPVWGLFDKEPSRYDIMYRFTNGVFFDLKPLVKAILEYGL